MLGIEPARIRSYANKGFLTPEKGPRGELRFGFHDLIVLRTASELTAANVPGRKVRRVLERLREQLPEGRALTGVRIAADGERVVVRDGAALWNPESGQSLFDFGVDEITAKTAPLALRAVEERPAPDAEEWFGAGVEAEASSAEEAIEAYERALAIDPQHADAHVNLGRILHERGSRAAAEKHYRAAVAADPRHDVAWFNLGVALEDLGRTREAVEAYERALALDPENADAHYNLAGIYERRGEKANAVKHLKAYRGLAG